MRKNNSGFTLIELLVVIAIIGILSSVVLASVGSAREKARDAKRAAQIKEIRSALDLFNESRSTYPSSTPASFTGSDAAVQYLVSSEGGQLLPAVPTNAGGGATSTFIYRAIEEDGSECTANDACTSFVLGVILERPGSNILSNDSDFVLGAFDGNSTDCLGASSGTDQCYDVKN